MKDTLPTSRIAELRALADNVAQIELNQAKDLIDDPTSASHHLHIQTLDLLTLFEALYDFNGMNESILYFLEQATRAFIKTKPSQMEEALSYYSTLMRLIRSLAYDRALIDKKFIEYSNLSSDTEIFEGLKAEEIASA